MLCSTAAGYVAIPIYSTVGKIVKKSWQ